MLKQLESTSTLQIVKEFHNEFGEQFVIYRSTKSKNYFVTGDEFDWEGGFVLKVGFIPDEWRGIVFATKREGLNTFGFSADEQKVLLPFLTKELSK